MTFFMGLFWKLFIMYLIDCEKQIIIFICYLLIQCFSGGWMWSKYFVGLCYPKCSKILQNCLGLVNRMALLACRPWDSGKRIHEMFTSTHLDSLQMYFHVHAWIVSPSEQCLGGWLNKLGGGMTSKKKKKSSRIHCRTSKILPSWMGRLHLDITDMGERKFFVPR